MPVEIRVPVLGESVVEATVGRWLKREGEAVSVGEPLVELETDKVNVEVPADESGVIGQILRSEGETVRPGDSLGTITAGDGASRSPATAQLPIPHPPAEPLAAEPAPAAEAASAAESAPAAEVRASPLAERLAEELKVDLRAVPATGPGGRVTREDVEAYAQAGTQPTAHQEVRTPTAQRANVEAPPVQPLPTPTMAAPAAVRPSDGRPERRQRLSRRRLTIARRLVEAQHTAAMLTTFNEVDMTAVMDLRARRKEDFNKRYGVNLGFMSFFTKASIAALKAFPQVNAELQGEELVFKEYFDIGIAIGDEEGLVVPVLRNAEKMSFSDIEKAIAGFVQKTKDKSLSLEDLKGGTFTITNGGVFGSLLSTPILNPPQVGILGMHKIQQRPVAINGEVVIRPMMYLALSYDHRIVDGREAVQFLVRIKELLEDPERLMLEG